RRQILPSLAEDVVRQGSQRVKRAAEVADGSPQNDLITASLDIDFVSVKLELARDSDRLRVATAKHLCRRHGAPLEYTREVYTYQARGASGAARPSAAPGR